MDYATVDQDTSIIIKWRVSTDYTRSNYKDLLLYKSSWQGTQVKSFKPVSAEYNDRRVGVDGNRYVYYTRVTDECGDTSMASGIACNILVQSLSDGTFDPPEFRWNQYRNWAGGIKHYEVQRLNKDNLFETVHITTDTTFMDEHATDLCMKQYIYRVIATEQTTNSQDVQDISTSNHIRIRPRSSLFVPNAFTPNHNGLNEIFAPKGQYIYNYQLEIYNRWGERVFISNECLGGWDGTYKGEAADEGIYYYKLDAFGNDGKIYSYKGLLTLLH